MIALATGLMACGESSPSTQPVDVNMVINNVHAWDGKVVTIDGWLGSCAGYQCAIFPSQKRAQGNSMDDWSTGLSIGFVSGFDQMAAPLEFQRVMLTARVNDDCFPANCLDRADILQPIEIRAWSAETLRSNEAIN